MDGSHSLLFRSDSSLALRCRKGAPSTPSFDLDVRRMDDLAPFGRILAQIFGKGVERAGHRLERKAVEILLLEFGIADDLLHVGVDLLDDVRRRARRGKQPE